jgi:N-acetylglutamate synthase-like GNAT family acetyltransferase
MSDLSAIFDLLKTKGYTTLIQRETRQEGVPTKGVIWSQSLQGDMFATRSVGVSPEVMHEDIKEVLLQVVGTNFEMFSEENSISAVYTLLD